MSYKNSWFAGSLKWVPLQKLSHVLEAQCLERATSIMEVVGSIPTWNNEMFFVVPSPVAKQPSLQHSGYFHDMTMSVLSIQVNASIIPSSEPYRSTEKQYIISEKRSRVYLLDSTTEFFKGDHYLG